MSDKDFNRKARTPALAGGARAVRKENRLIFAFSPALAPGASVALLAVSLTKNQETRLDFEKALTTRAALLTCHCETVFSRRSNPLFQEEIASQSALAMT